MHGNESSLQQNVFEHENKLGKTPLASLSMHILWKIFSFSFAIYLFASAKIAFILFDGS